MCSFVFFSLHEYSFLCPSNQASKQQYFAVGTLHIDIEDGTDVKVDKIKSNTTGREETETLIMQDNIFYEGVEKTFSIYFRFL